MENLLVEENISEATTLSIIGMMKTLGRLKKISSSLLFISRIENAQFARTDLIKPAKLIADVLEEIGHRMEEKELELQVSLSDDVTLKNVNQDLLFQFFYNLINNAIKYNVEKGRISISDRLDRSGYSIIISDSGIGIAKEELGFIFDRFRKTNLSENVGYGLGLSIVKSIAVYHGLDVKVDSVVGEGSTFTVRFSNFDKE
jgi:signal transduction histidine kinase